MDEYDGNMMMQQNRSSILEEVEDNQAWLSFRHTIEQVGMIFGQEKSNCTTKKYLKIIFFHWCLAANLRIG